MSFGEKRTETDFRERARIKQQMKSFAATLEALADQWMQENLPVTGKRHNCAPHVAQQIVERFGVTPEAANCMGSTLSAIDHGSVTAAYTAFSAHRDVWDVMRSELDAGTEFPWQPAEGFMALLKNTEAAGRA